MKEKHSRKHLLVNSGKLARSSFLWQPVAAEAPNPSKNKSAYAQNALI